MESRTQGNLTLFSPKGKIYLRIFSDSRDASTIIYNLMLSDNSKTFTGKYSISRESIALLRNEIEDLFKREFNPPEKYFSSFAYDLACLSASKQALSSFEVNGRLINSAYLKDKLDLIENLLVMNFFPSENKTNANYSCSIL